MYKIVRKQDIISALIGLFVGCCFGAAATYAIFGIPKTETELTKIELFDKCMEKARFERTKFGNTDVAKIVDTCHTASVYQFNGQ